MSSIGQSSWLDLSFLIESQLLPQEQEFCAQGCPRTKHEMEEKNSVRDQSGDQAKE
jgi:hypothetical protein